jgi:hypothetical protein
MSASVLSGRAAGNLYASAGDYPLSGTYTQGADVPIDGHRHRPEELHLQGLRDPEIWAPGTGGANGATGYLID